MEPKHSLVQHLKLRYLDGWSKLHVAAHEGDLPKVLSLLPKLFSEEQLNSRTKVRLVKGRRIKAGAL